jgi:hypothetical protein
VQRYAVYGAGNFEGQRPAPVTEKRYQNTGVYDSVIYGEGRRAAIGLTASF